MNFRKFELAGAIALFLILSSLPAAAVDTKLRGGAEQAKHYNDRGVDYSSKGDFDRAIAEYNEAISRNSKYALAYFNRGIAYSSKGDVDRAIADYTKTISLAPDSADAYYNRGNAYLKKNDNDRALADYDQAIKLDPKHERAYHNRSIIYYARKQYSRSIADDSEAIKIDPEEGEYWFSRGDTYAAVGDLDRAIADYTQGLKLNPKAGIVYNSLYSLYMKKADFDRAVEIESAAILVWQNEAAFVQRGIAYSAKGVFDRAILDYDQAIKLDPKFAIAYQFRGKANLFAGALPKALADLNQASALDPKNTYTALWLYIISNRNHLSGQLLEAAKGVDMTNWPAPVVQLYLKKITPDALLAAADVPDAERKKGQVCEANFYTAELDLLQGTNDEAIALFRHVATDCPKSLNVWQDAVAELKTLGAAP